MSSRKQVKSNAKWQPLLLGILGLLLIISGTLLFFHSRDQHKVTSKDESVVTGTNLQQEVGQETNQQSSEIEWINADSEVQLPILMYHAIHVMSPEEETNANLIVDPTTFESHIAALKEAGYYFLTPEEAYKVLSENVLPNGNSKVVWLTFDDSLWDFYQNAYPILKNYNAKATNNVITDFVDQSGYLTLDQMKEMKENGISLQAHTVTHPDLSIQTYDEQTYQLSESDSFLDQNLNQDTITIAYPSGRYSDDTIAIAEQYFKLGVTTNEGLASASNGLLTLNRVRILPELTAEDLLTTITN